MVKRFLTQKEVFADSPEEKSSEDVQCVNHYRSTYLRDAEGRFTVRYLYKNSPSELGDSRPSALRMLYRLKYRFDRDPELYRQYKNFMEEYEQLGHMSRVPPGNGGSIKYFFVHHPVFRETSLTTKIRVVFNGSWKTASGVSLNDILHEGPSLLPEIVAVITRWRLHRYVYTADIVKMFRQILMHPEDRCYQGILWFDDEFKVLEFILNTVTYGTRYAPFLATQTVSQLAEDDGGKYPAAKEVLEEDTYMDDIYGGADTIEGCKQQIKQVISLCQGGGFPLQKWAVNHRDLLQGLHELHGDSSVHLINDQGFHRTLGLSWDTVHDQFFYTPKMSDNNENLTKRIVLSRVAQIFDPLGWIAPFVVRGKIIIQKLWQSGLGWDEQLSDEFRRSWEIFSAEIQDLEAVRVPRFLEVSDSTKSIELHGFSDASGAAYGTAVYLKTIDAAGTAHVTLISSKSKLAPISDRKKSKKSKNVKITTPRLELMGALLLVRHVDSIVRVLKMDNLSINLWTDSAVVLYWIKSDSEKFKQFVRNRLEEIQSKFPQGSWRHVAGADNPADVVSRGISARKLAKSSLWWSGPQWMTLPESQWPEQKIATEVSDSLELKSGNAHLSSVSTQSSWNLIEKFSSLRRLLAVTAWNYRVFRVKREKIAAKSNPGLEKQLSHRILMPWEYEEARIFWIKEFQAVHFAEDIRRLQKSGEVARDSALFRLVPFLDGHGVLRVTGRLQKSLLDEDFKHPAILPEKSKLTDLILDQVHRQTLHGGIRLMMGIIRRRYWILGGRRPVTAFVHRCIRCARFRAVAAQQLMGQLPMRRLVKVRPFLHSGVDYAGPYTVLTWRGRGAKSYKAFIVIFICFVTSAVHIELATDYSTQGFLACYKRFSARRGICATLTSDCGTNLVGADRELRQLFDSTTKELHELAHLVSKDGTQWIFNPPGAPHHGGKWEAAVKSVKFHLKREIGDSTLTYEEFSTLLTQVEAILNSRPLCDNPGDPDDEFAALTPEDFLSKAKSTVIPEPSLKHLPTSRLSRYERIRQMEERLWERWSTEYIQKLQEINKWHRRRPNLQIGELVLLVDERYPPTKWPLARIEKLHLGADGLCRVVSVKTSTSSFTRPITKICPLPIEASPPQPEAVEESPPEGIQDD